MTNDEYAPTTDQVRSGYSLSGVVTPGMSAVVGATFDRWLAAHDAEVKAEALREAADNARSAPADATKLAGWLRARADVLEGNR